MCSASFSALGCMLRCILHEKLLCIVGFVIILYLYIFIQLYNYIII